MKTRTGSHSDIRAGGPCRPRCLLVGAGPGDAELLTLKAVRAIEQATLLLVDDLVSPDVLAHASPQARIVHVGKRGGCRSTPQAFIEKLMIAAVRAGERVVRLKGGDPLLFGRGGEEIERLQAAGIEVEVVNGVTAALAAAGALGLSLTHRDHAHGVLFLTGHARAGEPDLDWAQAAAAARALQLTLVIYMGVSTAAQIEAGLRQALPADTPVALVQQASLPQQRQLRTTLGDLQAALRREGLGSPCVIIVGEVCRGLAALHAPAIAAAATASG